jgi:uncharacterized 2Fe-2S/4Fe-4S cluster protein (DUF4445 family)
MKKLLIIPLLALAAGCGSQAGTVTSPAKTVTVTSPPTTVTIPAAPVAPEVKTKIKTKTVTDNTQVVACQTALSAVASSGQKLAKAQIIYINQIKAAYMAGVTGGSIDSITAKMREATAITHKATAKVKQAQPFADQCNG